MPERLGAPGVRRLRQVLGQFLDLLERQRAPTVGLAVDDLQRGDFVAVFGEELPERFYRRARPLGIGLAVACLAHAIHAHRVNDLLVALLNGDEGLAQLWLIERPHSLLDQLEPSLFDLFRCR